MPGSIPWKGLTASLLMVLMESHLLVDSIQEQPMAEGLPCFSLAFEIPFYCNPVGED
jgi:hypothetical protein